MLACCVELEEKSLSVTSFNIAIFTFIYFLPMTIIIYFNIKLIILVSFCRIFFVLKKNFLILCYLKVKHLNESSKFLRQKKIDIKRRNFIWKLIFRNIALICNFIPFIIQTNVTNITWYSSHVPFFQILVIYYSNSEKNEFFSGLLGF